MTSLPLSSTSHLDYCATLDTAQARALDSAEQHTSIPELHPPTPPPTSHSPQYGAMEVVRRYTFTSLGSGCILTPLCSIRPGSMEAKTNTANPWGGLFSVPWHPTTYWLIHTPIYSTNNYAVCSLYVMPYGESQDTCNSVQPKKNTQIHRKHIFQIIWTILRRYVSEIWNCISSLQNNLLEHCFNGIYILHRQSTGKCLTWRTVVDKLGKGIPSREYSLDKGTQGEETWNMNIPGVSLRQV